MALSGTIEIPNASVAFLAIDLTIPSAALLNLQVSGWGQTPDSVLAAIGQELVFDGLTISQKNVGLSGLLFPLTGEFSAVLQILNQSGQELDDTDLVAQFTDACNTISNNTIQINSASVTQVIGAPSGINSGTGGQGNVVITAAGAAQNQPTPGGTKQCGDPSLTITSDFATWLQCLTQKGLTTLGLLAIGLLIGIVLIVGLERRPTPV